mmetsp:Transcript_482/g.719  ORF Transcript_482/g.719 Transcript_482/m.719 type:complete len:134 (-) Transcript_482:1512-1913(-)
MRTCKDDVVIAQAPLSPAMNLCESKCNIMINADWEHVFSSCNFAHGCCKMTVSVAMHRRFCHAGDATVQNALKAMGLGPIRNRTEACAACDLAATKKPRGRKCGKPSKVEAHMNFVQKQGKTSIVEFRSHLDV